MPLCELLSVIEDTYVIVCDDTVHPFIMGTIEHVKRTIDIPSLNCDVNRIFTDHESMYIVLERSIS